MKFYPQSHFLIYTRPRSTYDISYTFTANVMPFTRLLTVAQACKFHRNKLMRHLFIRPEYLTYMHAHVLYYHIYIYIYAVC